MIFHRTNAGHRWKIGYKDVSFSNQRRIKDVQRVSLMWEKGGDCLLFTGDVFRLFIALFYGLFRDFLLSGELCVHE